MAGHLKHGITHKVLEVLALILWCCGGARLLSVRDQTNVDESLLKNVVRAVEKAAAFLGEDYASINLDGLYGIQLCQGSLIQAVEDCSRPGSTCPDDVTSELVSLVTKLREITEKALPYVYAEDPKYYDGFAQVIDSPYIVQFIPETLGKSGSDPGLDFSYDEEKGDACYYDLLGTASDNGRTKAKCTVTDECWAYMTRPDASQYYLTHQLLFFIIAEKAGCLEEVEKNIGIVNYTSVRGIERHLCAKIYEENVKEEIDGQVKLLRQDLFLERIVLCGILGFQNFFTRKWIIMILSWQNARGCFTLPANLVHIEEKLNNAATEQRELTDLLYDEAKHIDEAGHTQMRRHLMREKAMNGDCLSHKTGLAFGTLGVYLRYLLNVLYSPK